MQPCDATTTSLQAASVIPNNAPWWVLAGCILLGAALVSFGAQMTFERWQKGDKKLPHWFSVAGGMFGITMASIIGAVAGHLIWHWTLGLMCGICGAWGSQWILGLVSARFGVRRGA